MHSIPVQDHVAGDMIGFLKAEKAHLASAMKEWGHGKTLESVVMQSYGNETPGTPIYRRSQYFFLMRVGPENANCICCARQIDLEPVVVLNPERILGKKGLSIDVWNFSDCERFIAFTVSESGRDLQKLHVYDFENDRLLPDLLEDLRFPEVAWNPDSQSFIYNRYYRKTGTSGGFAVFAHQLGTPQSQDALVEDFRSVPEALPLPLRAFRSPLCFLFTILGTDFRNRLSWRIAGSQSPFRTLQDFGLGKTEPIFTCASEQGWSVIAKTTIGAERGRIVEILLSERHETHVQDFQDMVPESDDILGDVLADQDNIVFENSTFSGSTLTHLNRSSGTSRNIEVPDHAYISCGREMLADSGGFATCYLPSGEIRLLQISALGNTVSHSMSQQGAAITFTTKTEYAQGADDVAIPITLCWYDGHVDLDTRPTLLHVYGGFGVSMMLGHNVFASAWMRSGGIYAIAHVRGGGEFGTAWHDMGRGKNKFLTVEDFLACAEHLLSHAMAGKLACWGASHGGFVVTKAINDRPDLFAAVIADVPVTDLLGLETQDTGHETIDEYAADHQGLRAMSPLHGIRQQSYPPILVITADNDERVPSWHSINYVLAQRKTNPDIDIFLWRVEDGGHSGPSSKAVMLEEETVKLGFLRHYLMSGDTHV
jgi:prolyl oligopeptidase